MSNITTIGIAVNTSQVTAATTQLNNLAGSAENAAGSVDDLTQESNDANTSVTATAGSVRALTSTIIALGAAIATGFGTKTVMEFEDAMLGLQATARATTQDMEKFEEQARSLGATSVFSASQVGDAQKFLAQAGLKTNEVLQSTAATLNLAAAGTLDLATAADIASNVLGGMQLPVAELGRVTDVLAASAQLSNTNVTQLGNALSKAAPIATAAGISLESVSSAIGILSNNGLQAEVAATGFTGIIRQLLKVTPKAEAALAKYGLTTADVNIETLGLSKVLETLNTKTISAGDAITIFGTEAAAAGLILGSSSKQFDELAASLEGAEDAASKMANIYSSGLSGAFASLGSMIAESTLALGRDSGLAGALQEVIVSATGVLAVYNDMLPEFAEANNLTAEQTQNLILTASAIKVVGTSLLTAAGAMVVLTQGVKLATLAMIAFNAAASANPLVLLAKAAVVAGVAIAGYMAIAEDAAETNKELEKSQKGLNDSLEDSNRIYAKHGQIVGEVNDQKIQTAILTAEAAVASAEAQIDSSVMMILSYREEEKGIKNLLQARIALAESAGVMTAVDTLAIENMKTQLSELTGLIGFETTNLELSNKALQENKLNIEVLTARLSTYGTTVKNNTTSLTKNTSAGKTHNKTLSDGLALTKSLRTPLEIYNDALEEAKSLLDANAISASTYGRAIEDANSKLDEAIGYTQSQNEALQKLEDQQQATFDSWSDNISGLLSQTTDLDDVLKNLAKTLLQDAFVNPLLISVGLGVNGSSGGSVYSGGGAGGGASSIGSDIAGIGSAVNNLFSGTNSLQAGFGNFATSGFGQSIGLSGAQSLPPGFIGPANIGLSGAGEFISGGLSTGAGLGGLAANLLGLGSGDMLTDTATSVLGGAIGNALLPGIGGAIGSFLGTAVGGLFGGSNKPTEYSFTSQDFGEERDEGRNTHTVDGVFGETLFKVFQGRSDDEDIVAAMTPIIETINVLESSIASTFSADQIASITEKVAKADFSEKDADESLNKFVAVRLGVILGELDPIFAELTNATDLVGVASLQYTSSLVAINKGLEFGGPLLDLFDDSLGSTVAFLDQIKTDEQTIFETFASLLQAQESYYQNFFSEEERFETALTSAKQELSVLNDTLGLTGSAALDTKDEFRAYIDSLDVHSETGREALQSALGFQDALLFVASAAEVAAASVEELALAAEEAAETAAKLAEETTKSYIAQRSGLLDSTRDTAFSAADSALKAVQASIKTERDIVNAEIKRLETIQSAASSARTSLRASDSVTTAIDRAYAQGIVTSAANGGAIDEDTLSAALKIVSDPSEELYESFTDYQRDFFKTSIDMAKIQKDASNSLTVEEMSLAALDALEEDAQKQVDALRGIETAVLSVSEAMAELGSAIQEALKAQAAVDAYEQTPGNFVDSSGSNYGSIESLYSAGLGRQGSANEVGYWQDQLDGGMSWNDLVETFFKAANENGESVSTTAPTASVGGNGAQGGANGSDGISNAISAMYRIALDREPDAAGAAYWQSQLDAGVPFSQLKESFFEAAREKGETVNAFANGGNHAGGIRLVGERGAELEMTGPSRIMSNTDLMSGLTASNNSNSEHESKMNMILSKALLMIDRMYRQQQQWTYDALNVRVVT